MKKYILAIDQGTTSTRAILFDNMQNVVKTAQKEVKVYFPEVSWVVQDANEIWLSVLAVIAEIFEDGIVSPDEISSIGISNQRETTIIWNKKRLENESENLPPECRHHAVERRWRRVCGAPRRYARKGVADAAGRH